MLSRWKTVRVFISSTFSDMHAERDHLVKVVFPALRERLGKYRIYLVDIDLRWGVTREQADDDRALDLCLEQIDACRPLFLGILGQRYGYVPQNLPEDAVSKYGWIQRHTGKSITELEIVHGVLNDNEMRTRAFFYFRDNAFLKDVPASKRSAVVSDSHEARRKLAELKQAIRNADVPVVENYPCKYGGLRINWRLAQQKLDDENRQKLEAVAEDGIVDPEEYARLDDVLRSFVDRESVVYVAGLQSFGQAVQDQLWEAIQAEHGLTAMPADEQMAPDSVAEEDLHRHFMDSRLRVYVGRENVQRALVKFADGDYAFPALVTGHSGSGKSAALAKFVAEYERSRPGVLVIPHFIGASPASTSLRQMLHRFCTVLQTEFQFTETLMREGRSLDEVPVEIPLDTNSLLPLFRQFVAQVPADRRVVFVVDGLNQLGQEDKAHSLHWLPWTLPAHVKVITSTIDDPDREEAVLKAFEGHKRACLSMKPLTNDERFEIVHQVPSLSAKTLDPQQLGLLLENPATTNPMFLLVALEELRGFGSYEQLNARIRDLPRAGDALTELFMQVIERLEIEFDRDLVRSVFSLLASARSGLSERELEALINDDRQREYFFPVLRQTRPYLQMRGELLDFFHRGLYKAVRQKYLPSDEERQAAHRRLAGYFHRQLNPTDQEPWSGEDRRSYSELPYHQTTGMMWDRLESTLTAIQFLEKKVIAGMAFDLISDFAIAINRLPATRPQHQILNLLAEALRRDIHFIAHHSHDYPQALFQCLWNTCWWYDCPQAEPHYDPPEVGWTRANPPWKHAGRKLYELLGKWREDRAKFGCLGHWVRSVRPPRVPLGSFQRSVLRGHEKSVKCVAYSPDGCTIFSGSDDGTIRAWDAESAAPLAVFGGKRTVINALAVSPDGSRIVTGGYDKELRIWDASSGTELIALLGNEGEVRSVAYSPDGSRIASGSWDRTVRIWDAERGAELMVLRQDEGCGDCIAYSPDGRRIVSGANSTIRVWDTSDGTEVFTLHLKHNGVQCLAYSPDGRQIAAALFKSIYVWNAESGAEVAVLDGHTDRVMSAAFSPNGRQVVSGAGDKTVRIWDLEKGDACTIYSGHDYGVECVAFSPNGSRLVSASGDCTVREWDALSSEHTPMLRDHGANVQCVAFSPNGRLLASGSQDKSFRIWDAQSGFELTRGPEFERAVRCVAFSPDGESVTVAEGNRVRLFATSDGRALADLQGHQAIVCSLAFSGDGRRIASGAWDNSVRIWDVENAKQVAIADVEERDVEIRPVSTDGWMWSTVSENATRRIDKWHMVAISPDGRRVASGSFDASVRLWDADSGELLAVLLRQDNVVKSIAFSPDGRRIVGGNYKLWAWDVDELKEIAVFDDQAGADQVAFSPDGRRIASSSLYAGTTKVWDIDSCACLATYDGGADATGVAAAFPEGSCAIARRSDTVVQQAENGQSMAYWPSALELIKASSDGCSWSGIDRHGKFELFRLEAFSNL